VTEVDASDLTDLSDLVGPELATLVTPCSPPATDHQAAAAAGSAGGISMDIRHGQIYVKRDARLEQERNFPHDIGPKFFRKNSKNFASSCVPIFVRIFLHYFCYYFRFFR
jgi:hypothetical protein